MAPSTPDTSAPDDSAGRPSWQPIRTFPILAYHRVGEPRRDHVPTVTPEAFEAQLRLMKRMGFRTLDLGELVQRRISGAAIEPRTTVITFDDGYEETHSLVMPLLQRYGFCATVFVTPMEVQTDGFLTWTQVRALADEGMTIGSHTMHHTYLPLVSLDRARQEIRQSKDALEQRLQRPIDLLSYPIGGYTRPIQELVQEAGYRAACTTNRGERGPGGLMALRRIKITERDRNPITLCAKLSGYYDAFRRPEAPS
jgi:peptidoglycan/xylan/chitin deacetylase (PgdA/CDA1 family)